MRFVVSRYNQDIDWIKEYSDDVVLYDRSETPLPNAIVMPNIGSDWYDKLTYIIDNYDNLPDIAVYTKANLFQYISKEEFDKLYKTDKFTPLLTQNHKTYMPVCYYKDGMYYEINNYWYLYDKHPFTHNRDEMATLLGIIGKDYVPFAPGSNYIVPKENILKHPKDLYIKLRSYLTESRYPAEAHFIERGIYTLWS